jgi:hypothetical protein
MEWFWKVKVCERMYGYFCDRLCRNIYWKFSQNDTSQNDIPKPFLLGNGLTNTTLLWLNCGSLFAFKKNSAACNGKCMDDNILNTYGRSMITPRRSTTTAKSFITTAESTAAWNQGKNNQENLYERKYVRGQKWRKHDEKCRLHSAAFTPKIFRAQI